MNWRVPSAAESQQRLTFEPDLAQFKCSSCYQYWHGFPLTLTLPPSHVNESCILSVLVNLHVPQEVGSTGLAMLRRPRLRLSLDMSSCAEMRLMTGINWVEISSSLLVSGWVSNVNIFFSIF